MVFKEILQKMKERKEMKKEKFREAEEDMRIMKMLEERQKSSNERELERYMKEEREESIKEALEIYRKNRSDKINFDNNPLDIPNITNHTDWEVLKERNQFSGNKNMFANQKNIFANNKNIFRR